MRKLRLLAVIPLLAIAAAGIGSTGHASATTCTGSPFIPPTGYGYATAIYQTSPGQYAATGGPGVAYFYFDPFGVLRNASPYGPTAVYTTTSVPGFYFVSGYSGVAVICVGT